MEIEEGEERHTVSTHRKAVCQRWVEEERSCVILGGPLKLSTTCPTSSLILNLHTLNPSFYIKPGWVRNECSFPIAFRWLLSLYLTQFALTHPFVAFPLLHSLCSKVARICWLWQRAPQGSPSMSTQCNALLIQDRRVMIMAVMARRQDRRLKA